MSTYFSWLLDVFRAVQIAMHPLHLPSPRAVVQVFIMVQRNCRILNWNVKGLNDNARHDVVCDLVRDTDATIVCLQETKLQNVDALVVTRTIGQNFANSFAILPASQTRGSTLLATNENFLTIQHLALYACCNRHHNNAGGMRHSGKSQLCTGPKVMATRYGSSKSSRTSTL